MKTRMRKIELPIGTSVCLFGDGHEPDWSAGKLVYGNLTRYVTIEVSWKDEADKWLDTGVYIALDKSLETRDDNNIAVNVESLLVVHRYDDTGWDNSDPSVYVYGVISPEVFYQFLEYVTYNDWQVATVKLAYMAYFMVANPPSDALIHIRKRLDEREKRQIQNKIK